MPLTAGSRVGPYEIVSLLGAGGMGEVYRARDTRLARDVAVKVLPSSLSADSDRLRRFDQEARAASALNHPNVLIVHDVGEDGGVSYIVSELLDGMPLRDALVRGPVPARTALEYALQIARGLTAAHERGIVHRDLKPENLFVTREDQIKILDFGLAKLTGNDAGTPALDMVTFATGTTPGVLVGTVRYMSPEQVKGERIDQRSDIFSFGTVLHEMLSGSPPFTRGSAYETLHAILTDDPPEPSDGGPVTTALARIVRRCLEKDPSHRFQAMRDVAFAIEAVAGTSGATATARLDRVGPQRFRVFLPWLLLTATVGASVFAVVSLLPRRLETPPRVMRFEITPPAGGAFAPVGTRGVASVLAPDGHAAVLVVSADGRTQLYLRSLDSTTLTALAGTEDASNPFWSPDSRWIGFVQRGTLKKIEPGGSPQTICSVVTVPSGTWGADDVIVFDAPDGLYRVSATGGQATKIVALPKDQFAFWPAFLPDGRHFVYLRILALPPEDGAANDAGRYELRVRSVEPGTAETTVLTAKSRALYAVPGYLLFVREGTLLAQPFDADGMRLTGQPMAIAEELLYFEPLGSADFSVSRTGLLTYQLAASVSRLDWYTREGAVVQAATGEGFYDGRFRLSPDGRRLALAVIDRRTGNSDVWVADLTRGTQSRVTFDPGFEVWPLWSPDGGRIAFSADRGAPPFLHVKRVGDEGRGEPLVAPQFPQVGCDWAKTPAGEFILYSTDSLERGSDLFALPLSGDRTPRPFVRSRFNETDARFSPDGRLVAYVSDESGTPEVYVRPFAGGTEQRQVSTSGGSSPRWRNDGRELFYLGRDGRLMSVAVGVTGTLETGVPRALFTIGPQGGGYEVSPDGQRFLVRRTTGPQSRLAVLLNWTTPLRGSR